MRSNGGLTRAVGKTNKPSFKNKFICYEKNIITIRSGSNNGCIVHNSN